MVNYINFDLRSVLIKYNQYLILNPLVFPKFEIHEIYSRIENKYQNRNKLFFRRYQKSILDKNRCYYCQQAVNDCDHIFIERIGKHIFEPIFCLNQCIPLFINDAIKLRTITNKTICTLYVGHMDSNSYLNLIPTDILNHIFYYLYIKPSPPTTLKRFLSFNAQYTHIQQYN